MKRLLRTRAPRALFIAAALGGMIAFAGVVFGETIDPNADNSQFAYGEHAGWVDGEPLGNGGPGVTVSGTNLTGWMYSEASGWINLNCSNNATCGTVSFGVTHNGAGVLSGYAWGENAGWISFSCQNVPATCAGTGNYGVTINAVSGQFSGYAWGENIGWIGFNCQNSPATCAATGAYRVQTDDGDGFANASAVIHQGPANTNVAVDNCPFDNNPTQVNGDGNFFDNSPPYVPATDDKTDPYSDAIGDACDLDDDNDGIPDATETNLVALQAICPTALAVTNPLLFDSDNDHVADRAECILGSDPNNIASKPVIPAAGIDPDNDKLSNAVEALLGTNPAVFDTDGDGINDGIEFKGWRSNPLVADSDGDGVLDRCEIASLNGDTKVNPGDQGLLTAEVGRAVPATAKLPHFDINKDGAYNPGDQALQASFVPVGICL